MLLYLFANLFLKNIILDRLLIFRPFMTKYVAWNVISYNIEKFNENNGTKVLLTHLKEIVESAI